MKSISAMDMSIYYSFIKNIDIGLLTMNVRKRLKKISELYNMKFSYLSAYLFDDKLEFMATLKSALNISNIPVWINGINIANKAFIMINEISNSDISDADYNRIIHELIHQNLFIKYYKHNSLPKWLDEGIALFFANQFSDKEKIKICKHLNYSAIPDFNTLDKNFTDSGGYHLAPSIIEFIIKKYNIDMLYKLCDSFSEKGYYCCVDKLFDEWHKYVLERYYNFIPSSVPVKNIERI